MSWNEKIRIYMNKKFDYLVVGAGPFGAVFAHEAHKRGKSVLVIDRRYHMYNELVNV